MPAPLSRNLFRVPTLDRNREIHTVRLREGEILTTGFNFAAAARKRETTVASAVFSVVDSATGVTLAGASSNTISTVVNITAVNSGTYGVECAATMADGQLMYEYLRVQVDLIKNEFLGDYDRTKRI